MSLPSVIQYFSTGTYAVHRYGEGEWVQGRWIQGPTALSYVDRAFTALASTNQLEIAGHGLVTGDGPLRPIAGPLPGGLVAGTDYWVVVSDADHLQLSSSLDFAMSISPTVIDLSSDGSGTLEDVPGQTVRQNREVIAMDLSVQPMTEEITEDLPEGVSTSDTRQIWSLSELRAPRKPGSADGFGADRIVIDGEFFRVWKVGYYGILSQHWKATAIREEVWR